MSSGQDHGHEHTPAGFNRIFAIGVVLNIVFTGIETYYGWDVNSLALLADAGHNFSDVIGLVLAWGSILASKIQPDHRHTYGWQRGTILAAFANALLLLVAMGSLSWEALGRLGALQPVMHSTIIMLVAGLGIVVNTATALLLMRGSKGDLNFRGAFLHMAADALVSAGVVAAGALALWLGWNWLDPVVSLLIAFIIVVGTWGLIRQSLHLLFDGVPESVDLIAVRGYLESLPGVDYVHDLHVWAMGTTQIAMTVHLVMSGGAPGDAFLENIAKALHDRFEIIHPTIQIETLPVAHGCGQGLSDA